jgi:hypothetical protein
VTAREERPTTADIAGRSETAEPVRDEDRAPAGDSGEERASGTAFGGEEALTPLFRDDERDELRGRWGSLQTRFVDEPRTTVEEADQLVADLMQRLAESFAEERRSLESQWSRGDEVSTEDLRLALRRYRSFFERLLAA